MQYRQLLIGLVLGLVIGAGTSVVVAEEGDQTFEPKVIHRTDAPKRQVGKGQAVATLLAQGKNAYVGRLEIAPGAGVPEHRDPTEEYIYFLFGGGTMHVDGKKYEVRPGHLVYMPANAKVSYENGDETTKVLQFFAGPEPAKKYDDWKVVKGE